MSEESNGPNAFVIERSSMPSTSLSRFGVIHTRMDSLDGTGISSQIGTMLRDWAYGQAGTGCYSRAAIVLKDPVVGLVAWKKHPLPKVDLGRHHAPLLFACCTVPPHATRLFGYRMRALQGENGQRKGRGPPCGTSIAHIVLATVISTSIRRHLRGIPTAFWVRNK